MSKRKKSIESCINFDKLKARLEEQKKWRAHVDDLKKNGVKWPRMESVCKPGCDEHSFMWHSWNAKIIYDVEPYY